MAAPGFEPAVMDALYEHAFATPQLESAGILVGRGVGSDTPQITAIIPAVRCRTAQQRALLTHDVWARVHDTMGRHYATEDIIGWYLSRPDGIHLTAQDVATHQRYFPAVGQMALVFDAPRRYGGVYQMHHGRLALVFEGPVSHQYRPRPRPPAGLPWRGAAVLALLGLILGSVLWLAAAATGLV